MSTTDVSHVYAVVEHGTVTNVILATAGFAATVRGTIRIDHVTPRPGVGWSYANKVWTPAPDVQLYPEDLFGSGPLGIGR